MSDASHLDDFHCYICFKWPTDATLCPKCSKVCCNDCIIRWLGTSQNCPMCREALNLNTIVNCKWHGDIRDVIEENNNKEIEIQHLINRHKSDLDVLTRQVKEEQQKNSVLERCNLKHQKERDEARNEIVHLKKEIGSYAKIPIFKYFEEADTQIISKSEMRLASPETLRLNIERVSFKMMKTSLMMYTNYKTGEPVPLSVSKELESLTDLMNELTLKLKK